MKPKPPPMDTVRMEASSLVDTSSLPVRFGAISTVLFFNPAWSVYSSSSGLTTPSCVQAIAAPAATCLALMDTAPDSVLAFEVSPAVMLRPLRPFTVMPSKTDEVSPVMRCSEPVPLPEPLTE